MRLKNTPGAYGLIAKTFHWIMALIILGLLSVGFYMDGMDVSPAKFKLYWLHKSFGILILMLVAGRILWKFSNPKPAHLPTHRRWERDLAFITHMLLYVLIIAIPLSGWLMSSAGDFPAEFFGLFSLPAVIPKNENAFDLFRDLHQVFAFMIIGLIALHFAGALKHHFIDRDETLQRMTLRRLGLLGGFILTVIGGTLLASPLAIYAYNLKKSEISGTQIAAAAENPAQQTVTSAAPSWAIDLEKSTVNFDATQYGEKFSGSFKIAGGTIFFDPENMTDNRVSIDIDITSMNTGSSDRDTQVKSADWFDAAQFPRAHYTADRFEKNGPDSYVSHGTLTLRNVSLPVSFPFMLDVQNQSAHMTGSLELKRLEFGVGRGAWAQTDIIGDSVAIRLDVTAVRN